MKTLSDFRQLEQDVWTYEEEDVKEFIRLLKEDFFERFSPTERKSFEYVIDKLAGDKLI